MKNFISDTINNFNIKLDTVENLIKLGEVLKDKNILTHEGFNVIPIYDSGASIVIAEAKKKGDVFPSHAHLGIIQFLICFKGSFMIDFVDMFGFCKHLGLKDCASIPPNKKHKITALEDDSKLIGICIPVEEAYKLKGEGL